MQSAAPETGAALIGREWRLAFPLRAAVLFPAALPASQRGVAGFGAVGKAKGTAPGLPEDYARHLHVGKFGWKGGKSSFLHDAKGLLEFFNSFHGALSWYSKRAGLGENG